LTGFAHGLILQIQIRGDVEAPGGPESGICPGPALNPRKLPGITVKNEREMDSPRSAFGGESSSSAAWWDYRPRAARSILQSCTGWSFRVTRVCRKRGMRVARTPSAVGE